MEADVSSATILGVVLAGGLSRRMGTDKALLPFQGRTLLQHQLDLLKPICARVLVSGNYDGFDCVPDTISRCGPLGGMYSIAEQFQSAALLVIPVDMPQLTTLHLQALIQTRRACFMQDHPLPAFFPNSGQLFAAINSILKEDVQDFSIRHLHEVMGSLALQLADFNGLNVNEPQQWRDYMEQHVLL
ncbi:MAG: molybdenum cofactor guanylyltransferase [Arenimonas sp.]|nr:molybdenum cofactor guanylyltransferase [Arenimonas sp.]